MFNCNWCVEILNCSFISYLNIKSMLSSLVLGIIIRCSFTSYSMFVKILWAIFILDALLTKIFHSTILLKSVPGTSLSQGTPINDGLFSSFFLYFYNDQKLLINIISLPLILGTISPVTSFSIHKLEYTTCPMVSTPQDLPTKTL